MSIIDSNARFEDEDRAMREELRDGARERASSIFTDLVARLDDIHSDLHYDAHRTLGTALKPHRGMLARSRAVEFARNWLTANEDDVIDWIADGIEEGDEVGPFDKGAPAHYHGFTPCWENHGMGTKGENDGY